MKTVFLYDEFGRKIQESSDAGTVNYAYSGKTIQVSTSGGQTSSKTMDSQGNVISSTDNGGTISYTYKSIGKPASISNNGSTWSMLYDNYGRQTSLSDPNAGTIAYRYNKFGEMTRQLDAKGNIDSLTYDVLGRVATEYRNNNEGTKVYSYDPTGKPGLLSSVTYTGGSETYSYDNKSRLINDVVNINGTNYSTKYGYDSYSRLDTLTYPSTFAIRYVYNNFGYLHIVQKKSDGVMIWDATSMNSFNQYTQYNSGNSLTTTKTYDCLGMLRGITTGSIQNLGYSFDEETGNLINRRDNRRNLTEIFSYDNLGRLREVSGPAPLSMDFANNGNITSKTSVGNYSYDTKPHAVTGVTNPDGIISSNDQRITYTTFNKVDSIIQSNYKYDLQYGYQDQRTISKLMNGSGVVQKTVYYAGPYEKEVAGTTTKEFHYIYGGDGLAAILKRQSGTDTMYYVHKDHLGSFDKVTNSAGTVVDSMSFDAWGRRRNPATWAYSNIPATKFSRGYTGHEHLDQFDLINMNGRMYDPVLGRFLSPDPLMTDPYDTQCFNRYSYVLNNPLNFTDPSGYTYLQYLEQNYSYEGGGFNYRGQEYSYNSGTGGFSGSGGGYLNGAGYYYNYNTNQYYNNGNPVSWNEVNQNYIAPNGTSVPLRSNDNDSQMFTFGISLGTNFGLNPNPLKDYKYIEIGKLREYYIQIYSNGVITGDLAAFFGANSGGSSPWYYMIPGVGPALESGDQLNRGNYVAATAAFGMALVDVFTLGGGTPLKSATKTTVNLSVHAAERMVEGGITEKMIKITIENGAKFYDPKYGVLNYIIEGGFASGKDILVGVSLQTDKITTVIRGNNLIRPRFMPVP